MLKNKTLTYVASLAVTAMTAFSPLMVAAQVTEADCSYGCSVSSGNASWTVMQLAADSGPGGHVESFKVDRDTVAWTMRDDLSGLRHLYVWDGLSTRLLASMAIDEWADGNLFYEDASGGYDVADGLVVWTQFDGADREIFYDLYGRTAQLTYNDYDDVHPVTSERRIAWTAYPSDAYQLMLHDRAGTRAVAAWHVMNYAFSGENLFYMNMLPEEDWFRVLVEDGSGSRAVGTGDDRPINGYFVTDDRGSAAWEFSTKRWDYDRRSIFVSNDGAKAREVLYRYVPPTVTRLEDVRGGEVLVNVHDMLTQKLNDIDLLHLGHSWQAAVTTKRAFSQARFSDDTHVRHQVPENSSPLIVRYGDGTEDLLTVHRVEHNVFDAHADTIAAALHDHGGIILHRDRHTAVIERDAVARELQTRNGTVAWIEGEAGESVLAAATPSVLVSEGGSTVRLTGRLVTSPLSQAVYLAATNGKRYVFPSEGEFYGLYPDFGSTMYLSADEVAAQPLAGTVLYPAGTLLKTPSSPKVYSVGTNGALTWVTEALVLDQLYGSDWRAQVHDIAASSIVAYRVTGSVGDIGSYYAALVR